MVRQERERRFISEFMKERFPEGDYQLNVELGPIPQDYIDRYGQGKAAAIFRPSRPRIDAVKWQSDKYYLVEAKIRDIKSGIGDLMFYRGMIENTPDLPFYDGQPITCLLVVPWMIEWLRSASDSAKIEVVVFKPDWIDEYVKERQNYHTKEYRQKRAETMQLRETLGVD